MKGKIKGIIPGFIVCLGIGVVSMGLAKIMPKLGAATFAIFIGIVLGNTMFENDRYNEGSKFSESTLLSYSIILMGANLNLSDISSVGLNGVLFIILQLTLTISLTYYVGRTMKFSKKYSLLMGAGNGVCGSSAIASVAPVINADSKDKAISITTVNLLGTILMFLLPVLCTILYNEELTQSSAMIGGVLQSVGQVIGGGQFLGEHVVELATIFKIIRIIMILGVVIVYSFINVEESKSHKKQDHKKVKVKIPYYIIGFFIFSILNTFGFVPEIISSIAKWISGNFEIIALAGIGMRVKIRDIKNEGPKGLLYGLIVGLIQVILAIILIRILI